jgi:hypothetical protein
MGLSRRFRMTVGTLLAGLLFAPGWEALAVPVDHDVLLAEARLHAAPLGVVARRDADGTEYHVEYLDSFPAHALAACGLRKAAPSLVPPAFGARVPGPAPGGSGGVRRADLYVRFETRLRWPWWRPGGGILWDESLPVRTPGSPDSPAPATPR